MKRDSHGFWLLAVIGSLLLASGSLATGFTVDSTFTGGDANTDVEISPIFELSGTPLCLVGSCDLVSNDFLIFTARVGRGSVDEVGAFTLLPAFVLGVGRIDTSDVDPSGGFTTPPLPSATQAHWEFDAPVLGAANPKSDILFATFTPGILAALQTMNFTFQPVGGALITMPTTLNQVPEPATAGLLALGLLGLAFSARYRRSSPVN